MPEPNTARAAKLLELASAISKHVQIDSIALARATCQRNPEISELPEEVGINYQFKSNGSLTEDRTSIGALVTMRLSGFPKQDSAKPEEGESSIFFIEASFVLGYTLKSMDGVDDVSVDAFCKMNAVYNAWPYWREFVQSTVARMGLPNVTLPVLTVSTLLKVYAEQEDEPAEKPIADD
jgi:hypothetical protein